MNYPARSIWLHILAPVFCLICQGLIISSASPVLANTDLAASVSEAVGHLTLIPDQFANRFWDYAQRRAAEEMETPNLLAIDPVITLSPRQQQHETPSDLDKQSVTINIDEDQQPTRAPVELSSNLVQHPSPDHSAAASSSSDHLVISNSLKKIDYSPMIRVSEIYYNHRYGPGSFSGSYFKLGEYLETSSLPKGSWFTELRHRSSYRTLSENLRQLAQQSDHRFIEFCEVGFLEWIREWKTLESRVRRNSITLDTFIGAVSTLPISNEKIDEVFNQMEKPRYPGDESDIHYQWLEIVKAHYQTYFAPDRMIKTLSQAFLEESDSSRTFNLQRPRVIELQTRLLDVVSGRQPTGLVSESLTRVDSLGPLFVSHFRNILQDHWMLHFKAAFRTVKQGDGSLVVKISTPNVAENERTSTEEVIREI